MKKNDSNILEKLGRRDGMTVPEGFFDDFATRMLDQLPRRPEAELPRKVERPRTLWGSIRPYVYMAAMFAGIWCMLKMFSMMTPGNVDLDIERNHVLSSALSDENFVIDYINADMYEQELLNEMWDDSISIDEMMPFDDDMLPADIDYDNMESGTPEAVDENQDNAYE